MYQSNGNDDDSLLLNDLRIWNLTCSRISTSLENDLCIPSTSSNQTHLYNSHTLTAYYVVYKVTTFVYSTLCVFKYILLHNKILSYPDSSDYCAGTEGDVDDSATGGGEDSAVFCATLNASNSLDFVCP